MHYVVDFILKKTVGVSAILSNRKRPLGEMGDFFIVTKVA